MVQADASNRFRSESVQEFRNAIINSVDKRILFADVQEYDDYVPIDYVAAALDPRLKELAYLKDTEKPLVWEHITSLLPKTKPPDAPITTANSFLANFVKSVSAAHSDEVAYYRALPPLPMLSDSMDRFSDPLAWWKANENTFPKLSKIALRYLSIPASSATVERIFSRAGNVMTPKRTRIKNDIFEAQVLYKNFYQVASLAEGVNAKKRAADAALEVDLTKRPRIDLGAMDLADG
jgi:hypothetical protein